MGERMDTTVPVSRPQLYELREIALNLTKAEGHRVTLADVVERLIASWRSSTGRVA
jgi:hypothetical protein